MTASRRRSSLAIPTTEQDLLFQAWRTEALMKMPYFWKQMYALRVLNAPGLGTWAVDYGYRLYVDFDEVEKKGFQWNWESVLHEAMHLYANDYEVRAELGIESTDTAALKTLNVACDLANNDDLDQAGCATLRSDKMLPRHIGEKDNETPHYYFRALRAKTEARQPQTPAKPTLTLRPGQIGEGAVAGSVVSGTVFGFKIDPTNYTLAVADEDGQMVQIGNVSVAARAIAFAIPGELPVGVYEVSLVSNGVTVSSTLSVVAPSITLDPGHLERGWAAPQPINIVGRFTNFTAASQVIVTDQGGQPVAISPVRHTSATEIAFDFTSQVPDGIYVVTVIDGAAQYQAMLPVGLPNMVLNPANLPVGFAAPAEVAAICADFTFDSTTTFDVVSVGTMFGATALGASATPIITSVDVKRDVYADLTIGMTLAEGQYLVVANTPGLGQATAVLSVSDPNAGDNEDNKDGRGQGDAEGGGEGQPFHGCGSGSGGEAWDGELDIDDDFDGYAPAVGVAEKEAIDIATANEIMDYHSKGRGLVPSNLVEMSRKILTPSKTQWQQILAAKVRRTVATRRGPGMQDFSRRNRRYHDTTIMTSKGRRKIVVPASKRPKPSIELIRDTSGSMDGNDIAVVNRECEAIAKKMGVRGRDFIVTDVDAAVHQSVEYKGKTSIQAVAGRGGTSMTVGIEHAWSRDRLPNVIVVATDGATDWPTEPGPVPVIACIVPPTGHRGSPQQMEAYIEQWRKNVPDWMAVVVVDPAENA